MKFTNQERNTVLAALRVYQGSELPTTIRGIATNGETQPPMSSDGIDALCEKLNFSKSKPRGRPRIHQDKQEAVAALRAAHVTIKEIAKRLKISRRTVYRLLNP